MYKPIFKVAHKTVTELEWRCCPGYTGYACMEGAYHHSMPPFKGPPVMKGPPMKGPPMIKGPPMKGPPMMKGSPLMKGPPMMNGPPMKGPPMMKGPPVSRPPFKGPQWVQPNGPSTTRFNTPAVHNFDPPTSSSYQDTSFEPHPAETESLPEHQVPLQHPDSLHQEHGPVPVLHGPEEHLPEEAAAPESEHTEGQALYNEMEERLLQMEEEVQRLNHGLETLRGTVNALEGNLRASLREDANRMLSTLLSAAPAPVQASAAASGSISVGFGEIPGDTHADGIDGGQTIPELTELKEKVDGLKSELQVKITELNELKAAVTGHDNALKKLSNQARTASGSLVISEDNKALETMMDAKLSAARTEILGGFEKRVETAESRCVEKAGDVHRQCKKEQGLTQEHIEDALAESTTDFKTEMIQLQLQINDLKATNSCCSQMAGLVQRVELLEASMTGLNQSQGHLRVEMSGHKDHIEGILEGRLAYLEEKLNVTGHTQSNDTERRSDVFEMAEMRLALEDRMEVKLRALEGRLLTAVEELSNATAPALLEGHAIPTLETELESLQSRLEVDVDRVQKQINNLEMLCSSSCSSPKTPSPIQADSASVNEPNFSGTVDAHVDRLNKLNVTLQIILKNLLEQQEQESPIHGELTVLKFNMFSVNHTVRGLQESLGTVVEQVDQANSSWHEREARLAHQMKGVVQLVSRQASMLGSGERRLTRLKAELLDMKRRLADEVRGCRSTALGVQREVTEVGGRVASMENQCKGLTFVAEDLERIREELDKQSTGLLLQVNGTLSSHTQQLSELKDELRNCTIKIEPTQQSLESEEAPRGDTFTLN
ncbi:hypothetical protein NL108_017015 [Boleophthalmus pectinirostris]|nr:hypothetical protein NL108_017015 [Boleophthalmus pectinirostris]